MAGTQKQIETLEAQVDDLHERLALIEEAVAQSPPEPEGSTPAARSLRRATARRASKRRAQARALRPDTKTLIVEHLGKHPGATAGELAKGLDLNRSTVSSSLTQLVGLGLIRRLERGYEPAAGPE